MVRRVCFSISDGSHWRLPYALKKQQQGYIFNNNMMMILKPLKILKSALVSKIIKKYNFKCHSSYSCFKK